MSEAWLDDFVNFILFVDYSLAVSGFFCFDTSLFVVFLAQLGGNILDEVLGRNPILVLPRSLCFSSSRHFLTCKWALLGCSYMLELVVATNSELK